MTTRRKQMAVALVCYALSAACAVYTGNMALLLPAATPFIVALFSE